jgi:hypothetical protein
VVIDSNLTWEACNDKICSKLRSSYVLYEVGVLRTVYYVLVHQSLSYGITVWGHSFKKCTK